MQTFTLRTASEEVGVGYKCFRAGWEFFCHAALMLFLLFGFAKFELAVIRIYPEGKVFHLGIVDVPLRNLLDGGHLGIMAGLILLGIWAFWKKYKEDNQVRLIVAMPNLGAVREIREE